MSDNIHQPYFAKQALSTHDAGHDSFDTDKHHNWLVNGAGQGIYAHGRIHQQVGNSIFVGDLIHKRGHLSTDDILLMEEQDLLSMGEPLVTNSRLGSLLSMAVLPTMSTANGEGDLIAYYEFGVVSYNTFDGPRETRHDGEGKLIQKGWDSRRMVNHLLNHISAVGRYAVAVLTRDHLFRSVRGLHFLKIVLGEGTFRSENVNRVSQDVEPILDSDPKELLHGCALGYWIEGDRMFATCGLKQDSSISVSPYGVGFVSWHQSVTFTEDLTPLAAWEGLWIVDSCVEGIHRFTKSLEYGYGFVCSDRCGGLYFASINKNATSDLRDDSVIPIEWSLETSRTYGSSVANKVAVRSLLLEILCKSTTKVRVLIKTDATGKWVLWKNITLPNKNRTEGQSLLLTETLGEPPQASREATWVQVRVEGVGATEFRLIELDYSESVVKGGRSQSYVVEDEVKDYFEINNSPTSERW